MSQKQLNDTPDLSKATISLVAHWAKQDVNLFLESTLKDNTGLPVTQADIHKEMQWHIEECIRQNLQFCGILAPWGHAKTENIIIGRTLFEIGKDCNKTAFIISNTDENAKARIDSVSNYILTDPDYHKIFPNIKPSINQESWSKHKITVERESMAKDGTIEAYGVMTSGVGGRCDFLFFDDVVDMRNAITNPAMREQVKANIENVWLSRLRPTGMAIYVATLWHQSDATAFMLKNTSWKFLVIKVAEDFSCLECESPFKGKFKIPLWDYWNKEKLIKRLAIIGPRAFNRGFRQQALSDEDRTFPSSEKVFMPGLGKDVIGDDWPRIIGVDPFGQWVVLFVIAVNPVNRMRFVVEIVRGKFQPNQTVDKIIELNNKHRPQLIVCENNASQEAIIQWVSEKGFTDLPIIPFTTGKQKADIAFGLPSIEVEFANNAWCCPYRDVDPYDSENSINVWRGELMNHPIGDTADTVMACIAEGTLIPIRDRGLIPIENVNIGDYVWTHKNRWKRCVNKKSEIKEVMEICGRGMLPIKATPDHRFLSYKIRINYKDRTNTEYLIQDETWIECKDLKQSTRHKTNQDGIVLAFPKHESKHKWHGEAGFWLGLYLAEGYVAHHQTHFCLHSKETYLADFIERFANQNLGATIQSRRINGNTMVVCLGSRKLADELRVFGKCENKQLPFNFLNHEILRGWLVGDGSKSDRSISGVSISKALIYQMQYIAGYYGCRSTINFHAKEGYKKNFDKICFIKNRYRLSINNIDFLKLPISKCHEIERVRWGNDFKLGRRMQGYEVINGDLRKIQKIIRDGQCVKVFDLSIEDDHSFTANGYIVHNCWFAREGSRILFGMPKEDEGQIFTEDDMGIENVQIGSY